MDLLHSGRFDGFCLVSSDSDFTRLAARIREQGVDVYGFGEQKTPESFRQACRRFIYTENLLPKPPAAAGSAEAMQAARANRQRRVNCCRRIMQDIEGEDGWVLLGTIGNQLANLSAGLRSADLRLQEAERSRPQCTGLRGGRRARRTPFGCV